MAVLFRRGSGGTPQALVAIILPLFGLIWVPLVLLAEAKIAWRLGEGSFLAGREFIPFVLVWEIEFRCIVYSLRWLDCILM